MIKGHNSVCPLTLLSGYIGYRREYIYNHIASYVINYVLLLTCRRPHCQICFIGNVMFSYTSWTMYCIALCVSLLYIALLEVYLIWARFCLFAIIFKKNVFVKPSIQTQQYCKQVL